VGGESKPSLEDECDDTSPVEQSTHHRHFHNHIVEPNVIYDERKSVHERKKEKRIGGPSVKDLNSLMRNSSSERDPIRLGRCGAMAAQYSENHEI
jgi:hypothetical protein